MSWCGTDSLIGLVFGMLSRARTVLQLAIIWWLKTRARRSSRYVAAVVCTTRIRQRGSRTAVDVMKGSCLNYSHHPSSISRLSDEVATLYTQEASNENKNKSRSRQSRERRRSIQYSKSRKGCSSGPFRKPDDETLSSNMSRSDGEAFGALSSDIPTDHNRHLR